MAEIVPGARRILSFVGEEELSEDLKKPLARSFERTKTELEEYSFLLDPQQTKFNYSPNPHTAVKEKTTRPYVPMMLSLIPPDVFPSGEFKKTTVSAPQGLTTTLVRTQRNLPLTSPVAVSEARVAGEGGADAGNPIFSPEAADQETLVSVEDTNEQAREEFRTSIREEYRSFSKNAKKTQEELLREITDIVEGREANRDTVMENIESIRNARQLGLNEDLLREQVLAMRTLPPLFLMVNPSELTKSYEHLISGSERSREGYIVEHWGINQPTLSASGQVGGFYIDAKDANGQPAGGITQNLRRSSAAFQNLMTLFSIYRSNGYIRNKEDRISLLGSVKLYYDDTVYTGSFTSFELENSEDQPHNMSYSFEFTVRFEEEIGDQ